MDDELQWIERARRGDARAFEELVRLHQKPVYGMAMRMMQDHGSADEMAQRTFLRAWDGLAAFEGRSSLRTWLLTICMNLCRNHHRDHARFVRDPQKHLEAGGEEAVGSSRLEEAQRNERVRAGVARLPERQRQVVELRVFGSLPFKEIAEALGITENSAKVSFHHAVKSLKESVG